MMPNQKKNCREVCVQAQKLLEEKRRKEGESGRGRGEGDKRGWGTQGALLPCLPGSFLLCQEATEVDVMTDKGRSSMETNLTWLETVEGGRPQKLPTKREKTCTPLSNHPMGGEAGQDAHGRPTCWKPTKWKTTKWKIIP